MVMAHDEELHRLRRENKRLTEERDFLKKATARSTGQRNTKPMTITEVLRGSTWTSGFIMGTESRALEALEGRRIS